MIDWLLSRLREPSTYAGFAALASAAGISSELYAAASAVGVAVAGLAAILVAESKA